MGTISGDMEKAREGNWQSNSQPERSGRDPLHQCALQNRQSHEIVSSPASHRKDSSDRVALKSIGSPILGDGRYGGYGRAREEERGYLHAYAIRFRSTEKQSRR